MLVHEATGGKNARTNKYKMRKPAFLGFRLHSIFRAFVYKKQIPKG
jgi:hypothetical protein